MYERRTYRGARHFLGGHARQHKDTGTDNGGHACAGHPVERLVSCQLVRALVRSLPRAHSAVPSESRSNRESTRFSWSSAASSASAQKRKITWRVIGTLLDAIRGRGSRTYGPASPDPAASGAVGPFAAVSGAHWLWPSNRTTWPRRSWGGPVRVANDRLLPKFVGPHAGCSELDGGSAHVPPWSPC